MELFKQPRQLQLLAKEFNVLIALDQKGFRIVRECCYGMHTDLAFCKTEEDILQYFDLKRKISVYEK